jgi:prepilin-type N-terminal cleavage/methylation domain-containing protein
MKKAFSLIEMVMVIVVLGITAMIGTDVITHMYEGYIKSRAINKLQTRTKQVLDLIAKRLSYRVKDTAVTSIDGTSYIKLSENGITKDYNILEWIGYDNEGMIGEWDMNLKRYSGWSGFIDLDDNITNNNKRVKTSGSRLDLAKYSIDALSNNKVNFFSPTGGVGLIAKCSYDMLLESYGFNKGNGENVKKIGIGSIDILNIYNPTSTPINYCEQYYLVWSAYAIVPQGVTIAKDRSGKPILDENKVAVKDFNLTLRYNYRPWMKESYKDGESAILAEHVSTFRFIQVGHTIRVKLCMRDPLVSYGFCKEKAVF